MDPDIRGRALGCCMAGLFILMTAGCGQGRPAWDDASGVIMRPSVHASIPEAIKAAESRDPSPGHAGQRPCRRDGRRSPQRAAGRFVRCTPSSAPDDRRADAGLLRRERHAGDGPDGVPAARAGGWQRIHHANAGREGRAGGPHRLVVRRVDRREVAGRGRRESGALPRGHRVCSERAPADQGTGGAALAGHGQRARLRRRHPEVHPGHGAQRAAGKPRCVGYPREWSEHDLHGQRQSGLCAHAGETDTVPIHRDLADHSAPPRDASHRRVRGQRRVDPVRSERCLRGHPPEALAEHHHGQDHPSR